MRQWVLLCLVLPFISDEFYQNKLTSYIVKNQSEKVYLHLDKPYYASGDQIWFKSYLESSSFHEPSDASKTLYVELFNSENRIIDSLILYIDKGTAHGNIDLDRNLTSGKYLLRAYTNWMKNFNESFFFRKEFTVYNPSESDSTSSIRQINLARTLQSIDFLPEGGDLIHNVSTKVAVRATDNIGKAIALSGKIYNNEDDLITELIIDSTGYGLFYMTPHFGKSYRVITKDGNEYSLPQVAEKGTSIRVTNSFESEKIIVSVISEGIDINNGTLVAHQRGGFLFSEKCKSSNSFSLSLNKNELNPGIIHLTFFDRFNIPLSERLVFPVLPNTKKLELSLNKDSYNLREKVMLNIKAFDSLHSLSITVNPKADIQVTPYSENIVSYFLLNSDLKGQIKHPAYYLMNSKASYKKLDLIMLTHGWSRFNWKDLLDDIEPEKKYYVEKGITIKGKLLNYYKEDEPIEGIVTMRIPTISFDSTKGPSNEYGEFVIKDNLISDSSLVFIKAHGFRRNGKENRNVKIEISDQERPNENYVFENLGVLPINFNEKADLIDKINRAYFINSEINILDEVVVEAIAPEIKYFNDRTQFYNNPSNRIHIDSLGDMTLYSVFDLLRRVPGVTVTGNPPFQSARIRDFVSLSGNSSPIYLVDNIPVDLSFVQTLTIENIEFIDVLKGAKMAIFGSRGAPGAISIYTRRGINAKIFEENKGYLTFIHPGYHKTKEFYSPNYETPEASNTIPDYRTTIYWEPEIKFRQNEATISFYTSDQDGQYDIRIEGLASDGKPIFHNSTINVKK